MKTRLFAYLVLAVFLIGCQTSTEKYSKAKVLNNFVTELLEITSSKKSHAEYTFSDKRSGRNWIFISSTADVGSAGGIKIALDSDSVEDAAIVHEKGREQTCEAMRFIHSGTHKINVWCENGSIINKLVVRAIPDLVYCGYENPPIIKEYGPYDWNFMEKYIFKNFTTMIVGYSQFGYFAEVPQSLTDKMKKLGKMWIKNSGAPGLWGSGDAKESYDIWAEQLIEYPYLGGLIFDEFIPASLVHDISDTLSKQELLEQFVHWKDALEKISDSEQFKDKVLYTWVGTDIYTEFGKGFHGAMWAENESRSFIETVMDCDYRIVWERYIPEVTIDPTLETAKIYLDTWVKVPFLAWNGAQPGMVKNLIMCFGTFSSPPSNMNHNPRVNQNVWLDMQTNVVANDPAFSGIKGLMWWYAGNTDEEGNRWSSKLLRHYCIEGKTGLLSQDPYELTHIDNPDFDEDTKGWEIIPAEKGSIETKSYKGYGKFRSRSWGGIGDNFLWMKRSSKGPNIFAQEIKNLQPGRCYSMKMYTSDYKDLIKAKLIEKKHVVRIEIEGAEIYTDNKIQYVYATRNWNHPHDMPGFWMNYHWLVFRAKDTTATLRVSDWKSEKEAGGPIGQELIYNFIEVQPYIEK